MAAAVFNGALLEGSALGTRWKGKGGEAPWIFCDAQSTLPSTCFS